MSLIQWRFHTGNFVSGGLYPDPVPGEICRFKNISKRKAVSGPGFGRYVARQDDLAAIAEGRLIRACIRKKRRYAYINVNFRAVFRIGPGNTPDRQLNQVMPAGRVGKTDILSRHDLSIISKLPNIGNLGIVKLGTVIVMAFSLKNDIVARTFSNGIHSRLLDPHHIIPGLGKNAIRHEKQGHQGSSRFSKKENPVLHQNQFLLFSGYNISKSGSENGPGDDARQDYNCYFWPETGNRMYNV